MDSIATLQSLGLTLPSPAYIFGSVLFGLFGLAAFRYGRKAEDRRSLWLGVALMVYPYAVDQTWLLYAIGFALCVAWWGMRRSPG